MAIKNTVLTKMMKVKYIDYVSPSSATGSVAEIYHLANSEFGAAADPIVLHSLIPDLLAAFYDLGRETILAAGRVKRITKESMITAVSERNKCPYCVDAHAIMLDSLGGNQITRALANSDTASIANPHVSELIRWALENRNPESPIVKNPPFSAVDAPEVIGTVLYFHYVNRMANVFIQESHIPQNFMRGSLRKIAARMMTRYSGKEFASGETLDLPETIDCTFRWAIPDKGIAARIIKFDHQIQALAEEYVPREVQRLLNKYLQSWNGEEPPLSRNWVAEVTGDQFPLHQLPAAHLALLAAVSSYQIDASTINDYRVFNSSDHALLATVSWASWSAASRIGEWLSAPFSEERGEIEAQQSMSSTQTYPA